VVTTKANDYATTSLIEVWIDEAERRAWFLFEAPGCIGLRVGCIAAGIERRLSALWRSQRNTHARIDEYIIGRCEFLQPEAGLFAGIAQFRV